MKSKNPKIRRLRRNSSPASCARARSTTRPKNMTCCNTCSKRCSSCLPRQKDCSAIPDAFRVIGDGSPVETGARSYGKFLCDCRKTGNWKCDCKRQFADPDADWGWDSYRERYYYGRTLYMFCAADSPYNLPVYPRLFRASQHDTVSWICGYRELASLVPAMEAGRSDSGFRPRRSSHLYHAGT